MGARGWHPRQLLLKAWLGIVGFSVLLCFRMAKTSFQLIPVELQQSYSKVLTTGDRFTAPRVRRKVSFFSRNRIKGLTEKSLIPSVSADWALLSQAEKDSWVSAGSHCNLSGFKCFLKDRAFRIKNELVGYAVPSNLHQVEVGLLRVQAPATRLEIQQLHPAWYYVQRKVRGTRNQFEAVKVNESFGLPFQIEISYNALLTAAGPNPKARFYCIVYSHYQGRTVENVLEVPFSFNVGWSRATALMTKAVGMERGYTAFLEIEDARGDLLIDNVVLSHSGQNWARDPYCNDIDQGFTKAFYQVPKHWAAVDVPEGAFFGSVYYE